MDEIGEAELISAGQSGAVLDGMKNGAKRAVPAAVLRNCCHELKDQVDPRGLRLANARVTGRLDLTGLAVPFPLRFDGCEFDAAPVVEGAELFELSLTGCPRLPGLLGNGLRLRRDLDLSGSQVAGAHWTSASTSKRAAIWLCESEIGGRLLCVDTTIDGQGDRSIQADRIRVGGAVRLLHQFTSRGRDQADRRPHRRIARPHGRTDRVIGRARHRPRGRDHRGQRVPDRGPGRPATGDPRRDRHGKRPHLRAVPHPQRHHRGPCRRARRARIYARSDRGRHRAQRRPAVGRRRGDAGGTLRGDRPHRHDDGRHEQPVHRRGLRAAGTRPHRAGPDQRRDPRQLAARPRRVTSRARSGSPARVIHGKLALHGRRSATRARVAGRRKRDDGSTATSTSTACGPNGGRVNFRGATLGSLTASGARLDNPDGYSIRLSQAVDQGVGAAGRRLHLDRAGRAQPEHDRRPPAVHRRLVHLPRPGAGQRARARDRGDLRDRPRRHRPGLDGGVAERGLHRRGHHLPRRRPGDLAGTVHHRRADLRTVRETAGRAAEADLGPGRTVCLAEPPDRVRLRPVRAGGQGVPPARVHARGRARSSSPSAGTRGRSASPARAWPRRAIDAVYATIGYGYRPSRVLWLLAALLVLVTFSLELPASQAIAAGDERQRGRLRAPASRPPPPTPRHRRPAASGSAPPTVPAATARCAASARCCTRSTPWSR